ncbi:ras-specific guanine nucleotide-releasing factor RalGPS2 [Trichonephila inaurata madagascariensis]|uniref:Ras-specific guanine nucleotide-releasing factor RalGPS2 n=1 Tax=Trichonephila inaurata madagascariensis TaxID=2747483 RepID=A0A8X7C0X4_9ARAC|nr:ras-specific guanine nucleotide-releasing factor RalGPS2 [Trichonephila inaurata madagascariensis]
MEQKEWYWLKRKLFPVPHVRVPTAAFFTDVKATVYAKQLTLLDAESFGCSDISELGISFFEAKQSPNSVTFKQLLDWTVRTILVQSCLKRRARIVSHFIEIATILHQMRNVHSEVAILSTLSSAPIGLVSPRAEGELFALYGSFCAVPTRQTWTLLSQRWKRCLVPNLSISPSASIISGYMA